MTNPSNTSSSGGERKSGATSSSMSAATPTTDGTNMACTIKSCDTEDKSEMSTTSNATHTTGATNVAGMINTNKVSTTITSDRAPSPSSAPVLLDCAAFPHIFTRIVELAPVAALFPLRATCRSLRLQVDRKRLALHVVVDSTRAYTRYGEITLHVDPTITEARFSLHTRPELIGYTHTLDLDLNFDLPDYGDPAPLVNIIKAIIYKARVRTLDLDLIRLHLPDYVVDEREFITVLLSDRDMYSPSIPQPIFQAKRVMYFVPLASDTSECTHLPLSPFAGSQEVIINISSYGSFGPSTLAEALGRVGPKTTILFTEHWRTDGVPKYGRSRDLCDNFAAALGSQVALGGVETHLSVVGLELWAQDFFPEPPWYIKRLSAPKHHAAGSFRRAFVDCYYSALKHKLAHQHRSVAELQREASAMLSFVTMKDYEEFWSSLHPHGISIIRRWRP